MITSDVDLYYTSAVYDQMNHTLSVLTSYKNTSNVSVSQITQYVIDPHLLFSIPLYPDFSQHPIKQYLFFFKGVSAVSSNTSAGNGSKNNNKKITHKSLSTASPSYNEGKLTLSALAIKHVGVSRKHREIIIQVGQ